MRLIPRKWCGRISNQVYTVLATQVGSWSLPDSWEESLAFELRLGHLEGGPLAFAVLGEADGHDVAGEVDEGADDVILAERGAEVFELAVGGWNKTES